MLSYVVEHEEDEGDMAKSVTATGGEVKEKKSRISAMKEQIKRPLSSLLKRPASRSGSRDRASSRDRDGPENIELPAGDEPSRLHDKPVPKKMGMYKVKMQ